MKPKTNTFPIVTHDSIIIELEESATLTENQSKVIDYVLKKHLEWN